jgi:pyruvate/2-oxoglutarate dehydrogenase complex dihydrolipoamide acyltransferase (E2) component
MGSQPIGNPSQSAGTQFNHSCPPGHVIQRVDVRSGSVLDALKVQCTDGSSSPWYGGSGGAEGSYENTSGITGYGGRGAAFVDQLRVRSGYDHPGTWNTYGGTGGNEVSNFTCQQGEALQRVEGNYGQYVNRLQFWCGQFTQKQAIEAARAAAKAAEDAAKAAAEAAAKAAAEAAAKAAEEARLRAEKEQAEKVASMAATLKQRRPRLMQKYWQRRQNLAQLLLQVMPKMLQIRPPKLKLQRVPKPPALLLALQNNPRPMQPLRQ